MFCQLPRDWAGRSVILIGGGPSLRGFDFDRLRGRAIVVAINDAIRAAPWADVAFTIDRQWLARRRDELVRFSGEKIAAMPLGQPAVQGVKFVQRRRGGGLSDDPAVVHTGDNSGFAALGMALMRGAGNIALLGYDMDRPGHWHDGYEWSSQYGPQNYPAWAAGFSSLAVAARELGARVLNCNPDSAIRCFPFGAVDQVFE